MIELHGNPNERGKTMEENKEGVTILLGAEESTTERELRQTRIKIEEVRNYIVRHADDFDSADHDHWIHVCDLLNINTSVTKNYKITVELDVEVSGSIFSDWDDVSEYTFDLSEPEVGSDYGFEVESVSMSIESVEESY